MIEDLQGITLASRRISEIEVLKNEFHNHIKANHIKAPQPLKGIPGSISLNDDILEAECLGHTVQAIPRVIRASENSFAVEYAFNVTYQDEAFTVWCFYLTCSGFLTTTFDNIAEGSICEYSDDNATKNIIVRLSKALLLSRVFMPKAFQKVEKLHD